MATKKPVQTEDGKVIDLAIKTVKVKLKGTRPILLHNGQLADPLNPIVLRKKEITSKKKQARDGVASEEALAKLEFEGGLYLDVDGDVCMPGENIAAMIAGGGTIRKKGSALKRTVRCYDEPKLIFEGLDDVKTAVKGGSSVVDYLIENYKRFSLRKRIVNSGPGNTSTARTRPMFRNWSLSFEIHVVLGADVDLSDVRSALDVSGQLYGLGDWHGRYGLFVVEKFDEVVK